MNRRILGVIFVCVLGTFMWLGSSIPAGGATLSASDWRYSQQLSITNTGLIKINLPLDTLDAARPGLEDLRVLDDAGSEVPHLIEASLPSEKRTQKVRSFQSTLTPGATVLTLETGATEPIEAVALDSSAASFIKAVQVEGSRDKANWETLASGQPIFRQANGPSQFLISFAPAHWPFLRLTIDDRGSAPIPFLSAEILSVPGESATEPVAVSMAEREESPGQTRLRLNLPAAHLRLARLQIETSEPLFSRQVTVAVRQVSETLIRETPLALGAIYRLAAEGHPVSSNTAVRVESLIPSRELLLLIENHDSPPLQIGGIRAQRRPVFVVFHAARIGTHTLLTGNNQCPGPKYDLASLGANLKNLAVSPFTPAPLAHNPAYRPAEVLPAIPATGTAMEVAAWKFRNPIQVVRSGWQQLELNLEVLSNAQADFGDLRIVQGGNQIPYVLERTSNSRFVIPQVAPADDPKSPKQSRWQLNLPHRNLPIRRLVCASPTPLFQREFVLFEPIADERGQISQAVLGQASWVQTTDHPARQFSIALSRPPAGGTLFLETNNGDNPPVRLENLQLSYPVTRLFFKVTGEEPVYLYYGNLRAESPRYDLGLIADQLLKAEKSADHLTTQEQLKGASWQEKFSREGTAGFVFWGALGIVVAVLLVVINRLLPKKPSA